MLIISPSATILGAGKAKPGSPPFPAIPIPQNNAYKNESVSSRKYGLILINNFEVNFTMKYVTKT